MKNILVAFIILFISGGLFAQSKPEGLFLNSKAPDFKSTDQNGNVIRLKDELKKGPVVLLFYRGQWCPYCNKQLKMLEDSLSLITEKGAKLIAVTPEKAEGVSKTVEKTGASYSIISDSKLEIMKKYDVAFEVPEKTVERYKSFDLDLKKANGDNEANLPVPALYIINKEGIITFRYFDENYKKRATIREILDNL